MGVQQSRVLSPWVRSSKRDDQEVLRHMAQLMDELWRLMRYIEDLKQIWPRLGDTQRAEIEASSVHADRFHEKAAERCVEALATSARRLRSYRHWRLRAIVGGFLDDWRNQEPDMIKVLIAMLKRQIEEQ